MLSPLAITFAIYILLMVGIGFAWAQRSDLHPDVIDYVRMHPDQLFSSPPKTTFWVVAGSAAM